MVERDATIRNSAGIHCRPSATIVKTLSGYSGEVVVTAPGGSCDPRSIMELLALCLEPGTKIRIRVTGPDEELVARDLVELFEKHFDFPPRLAGEDTYTMLSKNGDDL